jgi:transposase-like protein
MRTSRFSVEQIAIALRQVEAGTPVGEICRKLEIAEATFYRWKRKFGDLGVTELRELRCSSIGPLAAMTWVERTDGSHQKSHPTPLSS